MLLSVLLVALATNAAAACNENVTDCLACVNTAGSTCGLCVTESNTSVPECIVVTVVDGRHTGACAGELLVTETMCPGGKPPDDDDDSIADALAAGKGAWEGLGSGGQAGVIVGASLLLCCCCLGIGWLFCGGGGGDGKKKQKGDAFVATQAKKPKPKVNNDAAIKFGTLPGEEDDDATVRMTGMNSNGLQGNSMHSAGPPGGTMHHSSSGYAGQGGFDQRQSVGGQPGQYSVGPPPPQHYSVGAPPPANYGQGASASIGVPPPMNGYDEDTVRLAGLNNNI